jgi:hypothetical protein
MSVSGWLNSVFSDDEDPRSARLSREKGRGPIGASGTSACPDDPRTPRTTPGTCGIGDEAALATEFGANPFNLSGKFELHAFTLAEMGLSGLGAGIFEYDGATGHYHNADELTYPHDSVTRGYYREGDVILVAEYSTAVLSRVHPEVEKLIGEGMSMLASSLGTTLTVGWVIFAVSSTGSYVSGTLAVLFGDDLLCLVEDVTTDWTLESLESNFRAAQMDRSGWEFVKKVSPIIANIATGMLSGTARSAVRGLGLRVAKGQLKRKFGRAILVRTLAGMGDNMKSAVKAFAKAVARKWFEISLRPEDLSLRGGGEVNQAALKQADVQRILLAGSVAFVTEMISGLGGSVTKGLGSDTGVGPTRWFAERLTAEIVKLIPGMTNTLISAHANALDEVLRGAPGKADAKAYENALAKRLERSLGGPLERAATSLLTTTGELKVD